MVLIASLQDSSQLDFAWLLPFALSSQVLAALMPGLPWACTCSSSSSSHRHNGTQHYAVLSCYKGFEGLGLEGRGVMGRSGSTCENRKGAERKEAGGGQMPRLEQRLPCHRQLQLYCRPLALRLHLRPPCRGGREQGAQARRSPP